MILYFVRHGESIANVEKVISNHGFQHPLTDRGKQQVKDLSDTLQNIEISHIYTSSLQRAVQTATILGHTRHLQYEINDALCEGNCGILEGRSDPESWQMIGGLESEWFEKGNFDAKIEGGESFNDIVARFVPFVRQIVATHSASAGAILLVAHGATLRVGLSQLLTNVDYQTISDKPMGNACYIKVESLDGEFHYTDWCGEFSSDR